MIDEQLAAIRERIGDSCGRIEITWFDSYDGAYVEVRAHVNIYGESRNIVGPGIGKTVQEAIDDMGAFIDKEEELHVWPWWSDIHSRLAWKRKSKKNG